MKGEPLRTLPDNLMFYLDFLSIFHIQADVLAKYNFLEIFNILKRFYGHYFWACRVRTTKIMAIESFKNDDFFQKSIMLQNDIS